MNCTFIPSLEHIALVKIATTLWNQSDIRALIEKFDFYDISKDYDILENTEAKIKEKVLLLNNPNSLKEKILCVIKPLGLEIYEWMKYNKALYNLAVKLPDEFSWTPHGTIDRKKTAEALMTDETVDITERYNLACNYCLRNYVAASWEKMPENQRASFYSEGDPMTETPEKYPFLRALLHSNKVAAEYFWSKLSLEDREDSIRIILNNSNTGYFKLKENSDLIDILRFLLPRMNKDQQKALLKIYSRGILLCFLQWPWQSLFLDMTNHVVLTNFDYLSILDKIVEKVTEGYKDYDYRRLFGELWQRSSENHKKHVIDRLCGGGIPLLSSLFQNKDMKNISLILKDASVLEKEAMCDSIGSHIFINLYCEKKFDMIDFFINEFISSHEMMIKFKAKCKESTWRHYHLEKFLDDLIQKFSLKRNIEENHCSSAERLCSSSCVTKQF